MGVERLNENEDPQGRSFQPNSEYHDDYLGSQTPGDNIQRRNGNSPDRQLRSLNSAKLLRKLSYYNSQDVGLEAAII